MVAHQCVIRCAPGIVEAAAENDRDAGVEGTGAGSGGGLGSSVSHPLCAQVGALGG